MRRFVTEGIAKLVGALLLVYSAPLESRASEKTLPQAAGAEQTMKRDERRSGSADGRVEKVPGGWRLKGDPRVYPFNPLAPADKEAPFPEALKKPGPKQQKQ